MKKWGKVIPVLFQLAALLSLVLSGVAGWKWGY